MEESGFILEFGNIQHLTGNAFAYWLVVPPEESRAKGLKEKYIVTNFIVSPLLFNNHTIAATFPPVVFDSREAIIELARKTDTDVIKIEETTIPEENFDFLNFFRKQLTSFNKVVTNYSILYTEHLTDKPVARDVIREQNEIDNLHRIEKLAEEARSAYLSNRNKALVRDMMLRIRKIGNSLNTPNFKYDVENMIALLGNPDKRVEKLTELYFKKFMAIYLEQYEEAERLKREIRTLAGSLIDPDQD